MIHARVDASQIHSRSTTPKARSKYRIEKQKKKQKKNRSILSPRSRRNLNIQHENEKPLEISDHSLGRKTKKKKKCKITPASHSLAEHTAATTFANRIPHESATAASSFPRERTTLRAGSSKHTLPARLTSRGASPHSPPPLLGGAWSGRPRSSAAAAASFLALSADSNRERLALFPRRAEKRGASALYCRRRRVERQAGTGWDWEGRGNGTGRDAQQVLSAASADVTAYRVVGKHLASRAAAYLHAQPSPSCHGATSSLRLSPAPSPSISPTKGYRASLPPLLSLHL